MSSKRLTPQERETIIELRLQRVSVRDTAERVGCSPTTVQRHWAEWLSERAEESAERLGQERAEAVARLDRVAADAYRAYREAIADGDINTAARLLAEERQALVAMAKVAGLDKVTVDLTADVTTFTGVRIIEQVDDSPNAAADGGDDG